MHKNKVLKRVARIRFDATRFREQFQEKCEAVFRPDLRQNEKVDQFAVSVKR
ncbi:MULTISPECIES: hypothetical protein [unclassified Mesorhizobium]|uniref:hypothetical protein n=1 Tax=unclassified Mesorhizobium TaxID=325217 RepID=UPI001671EC00|nr:MULTISPECIES: hypothetical protein [unclassified Mesorhizobium]